MSDWHSSAVVDLKSDMKVIVLVHVCLSAHCPHTLSHSVGLFKWGGYTHSCGDTHMWGDDWRDWNEFRARGWWILTLRVLCVLLIPLTTLHHQFMIYDLIYPSDCAPISRVTTAKINRTQITSHMSHVTRVQCRKARVPYFIPIILHFSSIFI